MSKANPVSDSLVRLPRHHSSCSPRRRRRSRPHLCRSVPWRLGDGSGHGCSRCRAESLDGPAPRVAHKRPLRDERRSDVRDEVSLVGVGRPTPSTMSAASSVPADPGSRATGRCAGQGSLGQSDPARAWQPRTRSPCPDTPRAWTQRSRAAPETPPEPDRWTGLTRDHAAMPTLREHGGPHADPLCVHTVHLVEWAEIADRAVDRVSLVLGGVVEEGKVDLHGCGGRIRLATDDQDVRIVDAARRM
jgi:hypothetical protein